MNDLDLEDLESHLYSQVYHGSDEVQEQSSSVSETAPSNLNNLSKSTNEMRRPNPRYFGAWNPGAKFQKPSNAKSPRMDGDKPGLYGKTCDKSYKPDLYKGKGYTIGLVCATTPIRYMNSKQRGRANRKAKRKEKKMKKLKEQADRQENSVKLADDTVITLSDSEDDSCVIVDNNKSILLVTDSKKLVHDNDTSLKVETLNDSLTDDVIFVEPTVAPIEIISIDEELDQQEKSSLETASSENLSINSTSQKSLKELQRERKELLSTPDSASNDFMSNSGINLNQTNFNFSLHGSDFNSGDFLKPAPKNNETCETESSSSTTDANTLNSIKNVVFNEIDFPNFAENNLESFGNFITPLRCNAVVDNIQSSPVKPPEVQNKNAYSSNSSSESELEDTIKDMLQKTKQLPELSPMQSVTHKVQKHKSSKYDLLDPTLATLDVIEKTTKKKRRKKKKVCSNEEGSGNVSRDASDDDLKPKKRKSSSSEIQKKKVSLTTTTEVNKTVSTTEVENDCQPTEVRNSSLTSSESILSEVKSGVEKMDNSENIEISSSSKSVVSVIDESDLNEKQVFNSPSRIVVFDETDYHDVSMELSSDSASVLSPLIEPPDIQLNFANQNNAETGRHTFSVLELQRKMSDDPKLWEILDSDRYPTRKPHRRRQRCHICRQTDHTAIRCPNKSEFKCRLCGVRGHLEPRCPNKICMQCSRPTSCLTSYCRTCFQNKHYPCKNCFIRGHHPELCPDKWRRYYLTVTEGPLVTYDQLQNKRRFWCSACAQEGHLEHSCRFHTSVYPAADPLIKNFEDIYATDKKKARLRFERPDLASSYDNTPQMILFDQGSAYNQNPNSPENQGAVNPHRDGIFVAGQQNFFHSLVPNLISISYPGARNQTQLSFDAPSFVNFEPEPVKVPNVDPPIETKTFTKRCNAIFFSSSISEIQHFINSELHRLSKFSLSSNRIAKDLKKRQVPRQFKERAEYFETLNMLLFGVFNMMEGKMHLERLKHFKRETKYKFYSNVRRRVLQKSYCYIFGSDQHKYIDYHELLRQI